MEVVPIALEYSDFTVVTISATILPIISGTRGVMDGTIIGTIPGITTAVDGI